jgi:hypothetical protein
LDLGSIIAATENYNDRGGIASFWLIERVYGFWA